MTSRPPTIERSPIPHLLGQNFIFGVSSTVLCTAANTLFLTEFGAGSLSHVYIGLALFVPIVSFLYAAIYRRLSSAALALAATATFSALCLGGWAIQSRGEHGWVAYALLMGWNAYMLVSYLIHGDQIQRLFNVREIKRAVPMIMAGSITGAILGGLMVAPLVAYLGTPAELLLVVGLLLPVNLALQLYTIHQFPALRKPRISVSPKNEKAPMTLAKLLGTRYVRLILVYGICYALTLRLVGYLFMSSADEFSSTPERLSQVLGLTYSVGTAGSLAFVLFVSTRLLNRFGLGTALAGSPIIIGPIIIAATGVIFLGGPQLSIYFWLIAGAFLMTHVLDSGTTTTALRTTLQALPISERSSAEAAARGLGPSIANGVAGISLLLLHSDNAGGGKWILVFTVAICGCWIVSSAFLYRDYAKLLLKSISRRALGSSNLKIEDVHTLSVIEHYLASSDPRHTRLALDILPIILQEG